MGSDRLDRFNKRKEKQVILESKNRLLLAPNEQLVQDIMNATANKELFLEIQKSQEQRYAVETDCIITSANIDELLNEIGNHYDESKLNLLMESAKESVLSNIIKPFGLAKVLFEDKEGGNVTTINNAKQGIYANEKDEYKNSKKEYNFQSAGVRNSFNSENGFIKDQYTGKAIPENKADIDHIRSMKMFHDNGGYMLGADQKEAFARDERNFAITDRSLNRSKSADELDVFINKQSNGREVNNKEYFDIDGRRIRGAETRANKAIEEHLPSTKEKVQYYAKESAITGVGEGFKMGLQQAIGLMLRELVIGIFDEAKDIFNNGLKGGRVDESFFRVTKERLERISQKILVKWKDVVKAFGQGSISGFFSNIITVVINTFFTTVKNGVRIIREGLFSLLQAIKILVNPPEGLTPKEAAHEATKIFASGLTITGGILIEEGVSKLILSNPILAPFANTLSTVIVGIATGLTASLMVYMLDKIDVFGVDRNNKHEYVVAQLDLKISESLKEADRLFEVFELPNPIEL